MDFPDYIMKNEIINDLNYIISEIEYYKSKKDLIRFLTRIDSIINNNKKDLFKEIIKELILKIKNSDLTETELKTIERVIFGFLIRNEKAYVSKKTIEIGIIYEYKDHYSLYIKKKQTNIKKFIDEIFPNHRILSIYLDDVKWKSLDNLTQEDLKHCSVFKINISK